MNKLLPFFLFAVLLLPIFSSGGGSTDFSPVHKFNYHGLKILGEFSDHYYTLQGLHHPWQQGKINQPNVFQNYQDLYPTSRIRFFDTLEPLKIAQYNKDLKKTRENTLSLPDSPYQTSACFTYQGIVWLFYTTPQQSQIQLKLKKFNLRGEGIGKAHSLMSTTMNKHNKALPFFIQLNGSEQRFIVLNGKDYKIYKTRVKQTYKGSLPYEQIRYLRLDDNNTLYFIDKREVNGEQKFDFVKYFPRIGSENRNTIETKGGSVLDVIFKDGPMGHRLNLVGIQGKSAPDQYFRQSFMKTTFQLANQQKGPLKEPVKSQLSDFGSSTYRLTGVKQFYDQKALVIQEIIQGMDPTEGGVGRLMLQTFYGNGDEVKAAYLNKQALQPANPAYYGYHLINYDDNLYTFFNRFTQEEHEGLFRTEFPGKARLRPDRILRSQHGGVITCPRLMKRISEDTLLLYGFKDQEYRLIRYRFE